jgi:hypothetical protein
VATDRGRIQERVTNIQDIPVTGTSRVSKETLKKREIAAKRQMQGQ